MVLEAVTGEESFKCERESLFSICSARHNESSFLKDVKSLCVEFSSVPPSRCLLKYVE